MNNVTKHMDQTMLRHFTPEVVSYLVSGLYAHEESLVKRSLQVIV